MKEKQEFFALRQISKPMCNNTLWKCVSWKGGIELPLYLYTYLNYIYNNIDKETTVLKHYNSLSI